MLNFNGMSYLRDFLPYRNLIFHLSRIRILKYTCLYNILNKTKLYLIGTIHPYYLHNINFQFSFTYIKSKLIAK